MKARTFALVLCVVLAGCAGGSATPTPTDAPKGEDSPTPTATDSATPTPTETATPSPTRSPTATPLPEAAHNPWEKAPVTVAIVNEAGANRDLERLVKRALVYWEENAPTYTPYQIDYELVESEYEADIVVSFVSTIEYCGGEAPDTVAGCASYIPEGDEPPETTEVDIETGYTDNSTVMLLKHEFGHTLGLTHNDSDELAFMTATNKIATPPKPDLSERDWKWNQSTIRIYVDASVAADHREEKIRDEVRQVIWTYNDYDHEKIPENASLKMVDDPDKAEIVVRIVEQSDDKPYSDYSLWQFDPDYDGNPEYFTYGEIRIQDKRHDDIGSHVGYWLGWMLYADGDDDLPGPYQAENVD